LVVQRQLSRSDVGVVFHVTPVLADAEAGASVGLDIVS
jgi:hypothetical protein